VDYLHLGEPINFLKMDLSRQDHHYRANTWGTIHPLEQLHELSLLPPGSEAVGDVNDNHGYRQASVITVFTGFTLENLLKIQTSS